MKLADTTQTTMYATCIAAVATGKVSDMKIIKCCIGCDCENCEEYKKMKTLECLKMWIYFHPFLFSAIISIILLVVFIFCVKNFTPTYFAEATIADIGYKGLTVTYKDEYGGEILQSINQYR